MSAPLLEASAVEKRYALRRGGSVAAVAGVDLSLARGAALGLVGESGCGKSTLARLLLRLVPVSAGRLVFDGVDITSLPERALRPLRRRMQIIHQNPSAALDPRLTVAQAVAEPLIIQRLARGAALRERVAALLAEVGLGAEFFARHPHALSGGQKQRVCIARALATEPDLLVLDEPTSALDVSVQAQILEFLEGLRARRGLAWVFISHNLAVVRLLCEEVAVMYLGRIVEQGPAAAVLGQPAHPYTRALLASVPRLGAIAAVAPGEPPNPAAPPSGCAFHPRCPLAEPRCRVDAPALRNAGTGHAVACHLVAGAARGAG